MTLIGIIALAAIGWSIAATLVFALMFAARTREELERTLSATLALLEETNEVAKEATDGTLRG